MATSELPIELSEEEYTPELAEALKEYRDLKEQEGPGLQPVTADKLPKEVKEAVGLDLFPEDIQKDIVALVVKLTDYGLHLADQLEQEAPFGPAHSSFGRFTTCAKQAPYRALIKSAWQGGSTAASAGRYLPGAAGKAARPFMRPLGAASTFAGGWLGHTIGCMRR